MFQLQLVRTPEEALQDEALLRDGAVVDVPHPEHGLLRQVGILYGLDRTPGRVQGPPPRVGEHTDEVLAEHVPQRQIDGAGNDGRPPLAGVTVLDLGFAVAGPFGTHPSPTPLATIRRRCRLPG